MHHSTHKWVECRVSVVLSVAKLTPGQEGYYERSVAAGIDDYYAGRGESPGVWIRPWRCELELEGVVEEGELGRLIRGVHPHTERGAAPASPKARQITIERIDPITGERWLEPKTLAPGRRLRPRLLAAEERQPAARARRRGDAPGRQRGAPAAWQAALAYLEDEACVTRRGRTASIASTRGGFVAAAYQHRTSRAQDPHLHTHVIVANMAADAERRQVARARRRGDPEDLPARRRLPLPGPAARRADAHARRRVGATPRRAWPSSSDVPRSGDRASSRAGAPRSSSASPAERRRLLRRPGRGASRPASGKSRSTSPSCARTGARAPPSTASAIASSGRSSDAPRTASSPRDELLEIARAHARPGGSDREADGLLATPTLVMAWAQAHTPARPSRACSPARRTAHADRRRRAASARQPSPGRPARYSTAELLAIERRALALVERGRDAQAPAIAPERPRPDRARRSSGALRRAGGDGARRRHEPGPGRLRRRPRRRRQDDRHPRRRRGIPRGRHPGARRRAVRRRSREAPGRNRHPSPPRSIACSKTPAPTGCPPARVLVVDEAGMAETRILAPAARRVEQAGGKAILIGDPHQLPAVGAGGLFAGIVERHGAIELTENRRQRDQLERRRARTRPRRRRPRLPRLRRKRGRLVVSETPLATRARLLADWWQHARDDLRRQRHARPPPPRRRRAEHTRTRR